VDRLPPQILRFAQDDTSLHVVAQSPPRLTRAPIRRIRAVGQQSDRDDHQNHGTTWLMSLVSVQSSAGCETREGVEQFPRMSDRHANDHPKLHSRGHRRSAAGRITPTRRHAPVAPRFLAGAQVEADSYAPASSAAGDRKTAPITTTKRIAFSLRRTGAERSQQS